MSAVGRALALGAALLAVASGAAAQEASPGFVLARYASRTALGFYAGYPAGTVLAVVGMIQNPRTQYREAIVGAGARLLDAGGLDLLGTVAVANTADGWYSQFYLLPSWQAGPLAVAATLEYYLLLDRTGVGELDVTPATAIVTISRTVGVGAAAVLSAPAGPAGVPVHGAAGPALQRGIPRGVLRLDLLHGLGGGSSELRVTVQCAWR